MGIDITFSVLAVTFWSCAATSDAASLWPMPMAKGIVRDDTIYVAAGLEWNSGNIVNTVLQELRDHGGMTYSASLLFPMDLSRQIWSHDQDRVQYCWDISDGYFWNALGSTDLELYARDRIFTMRRMPVALLDQWPLRDVSYAESGVLQKCTNNVAQQVTDEDVPLRPLRHYNTLAYMFKTVGKGVVYDIIPISVESFLVYLAVGERMTVWYYSYGSSHIGQTLGPVVIAGQPLYRGSKWLRVAIFDVPFDCAFRVFHHGKKVLFWCEDGRVFDADGLDKPRLPEMSVGVVEPNATDYGMSITREALDRFKGVNEKRVTVRQVDDLSGVTMAIRDDDRGNIYWVMKDKMVDNSSPRREAKLDKPGPVPADASGPIVEIYKLMPALRELRRE